MTIPRRVVKPEVIDFLSKAELVLHLTQRERISLGILVQHEAMTARDLCETLELTETSTLANWLDRLLRWGVVRQIGRTSGTRYFVDPDVLRKLEFPSQTTLARIEPYRIRELVLEDVQRHPGAAFGDIHSRIGEEIPDHHVRKQIKGLIEQGVLRYEGDNRWRRYWLV